MKPEEKRQMLLQLSKDVATNLILTIGFAAIALGVMRAVFHVELQISSTSLILGIIGATIAFAGNNFVADGLGRYNAHGTPQFIWGNRMQSVGFALTLVALLVK